MRKDPLPVSSEYMLERIVAYGKRAPGGLEALPVPALVRMIRRGLRMTQAQLAKRAGIAQSHLAVIESGKRDPNLSTLRKVFSALGGELLVVGRFQTAPAAMVAQRIHELARKRVARVAGSMSLEGQLPDGALIKKLVKAQEARLSREASSEIWEDE